MTQYVIRTQRTVSCELPEPQPQQMHSFNVLHPSREALAPVLSVLREDAGLAWHDIVCRVQVHHNSYAGAEL